MELKTEIVNLIETVNNFVKFGQFEEAIKMLNTAIKINPKDEYALALRGNCYNCLGNSFLALSDLKKALKINPNNAFALKIRGKMHYEQDSFYEALEDLTLVLQIDPNDGDVFRIRGEVYKGDNKTSQALEDLNQALQLNPYDWKAFTIRGEIYMNQGETYMNQDLFKLALEDLNQALQINSYDKNALKIRGKIHKFLGEYERALEDLNQVLGFSIEPNNVSKENWDDSGDQLDWETLGVRGEIHKMLAQYDLALKDLNLSLKIEPSSVHLYIVRGEIYKLQGEYDLALEDLKCLFLINLKLFCNFYAPHFIYYGNLCLSLHAEGKDESNKYLKRAFEFYELVSENVPHILSLKILAALNVLNDARINFKLGFFKTPGNQLANCYLDEEFIHSWRKDKKFKKYEESVNAYIEDYLREEDEKRYLKYKGNE